MTDTDMTVIADRFRNASLGMAPWIDAVAGAARAAGGRIGQLTTMNDKAAQFLNVLSGTSDDEVTAYYLAGGPDPARNPRTRAVLQAAPGRCVTERDFATPAMLDRTPIYTGLFRQSDVPFSAHVRLDGGCGAIAALSMLYPRSAGHPDAAQIALLTAIGPSIGSAVRTATALGSASDLTLVRTLEGVTGPAILVGGDRSIVALSPAAEALVRDATHLTVRRGCLAPADARNSGDFDTACAAVADPVATLRGNRKLLLGSADGMSHLLVEICALPARLSGPISAAKALVVVHPSRPAGRALSPATLAGAFALTPAEAELAILLLQGWSLATAAAKRGVSLNTVRSQLKSIFDKTGCNRQAQLVLMLRPYC